MRYTQFPKSLLFALCMAAASPAVAQDAPCGGFGVSGTWIGGSQDSSVIDTLDSYAEQMALVVGGSDYVAFFSLDSTTDVRIEAAGRGSGDPMIDLLAGTGGIIMSDDDSGGDGASRIETTLDAGDYCVAVRSFDGSPMTSFVRVGRMEHEPLTMGIPDMADPQSSGGCDAAVEIGGLNSSATGSAFDVPHWQFTLDQPAAVTIRAENEDADPVITLFDSAENYIAENDDFDGLNAQIDLAEPLEAGTYCINVTALSNDGLPITVSVTEYDAQAALMALYARGEAAPAIGGDIPITDLGTLETRLRQDVQVTDNVTWFSLDMADDGLLVVEAIGNGDTDPWLVVYDDLGREVGMNDDYGNGLDSLVMARVQYGTYLIGVRQYDGGQGFLRLVAERYVRAR